MLSKFKIFPVPTSSLLGTYRKGFLNARGHGSSVGMKLDCSGSASRSNPHDEKLACARSGKTNRMKCVVVGAGVKGLYAARRLLASDVDVTLLEELDIAGGKIKTVRSSCGTARVEMGAMRILDSHQMILSLLDELKLQREEYIEDNGNCPFSIQSQHGRVRDLCLGTLLDSALIEPQTFHASGLSRDCTFGRALSEAFQSVSDIDLSTTVDTYLSEETDPESNAKRSIAATILELRNGKDGLHTIVEVRELLELVKLHNSAPLQIKGGFDKLVHALVANLPEEAILFGSSVTRVVQSPDKVTVQYSCRDGPSSLDADAVLLTNGCLQQISFEPGLPAMHKECVNQLLDCHPAMKSALLFREKFWEHKNIIGGTSWVGPSAVNLVQFPQRNGGSGDKGFLMVYLFGEPMGRWKRLAKAERCEQAIAAVELLFPDVEVKELLEEVYEQWWDKDGCGAFYFKGASELLEKMRPHHRVVFSSVPRGWINDALIDGEAAVIDILKLLSSMSEGDKRKPQLELNMVGWVDVEHVKSSSL